MEKIEPNYTELPSPGLNIVPAPNGSVMRGGATQSSSFVKGVSGWQIDAAGNAEFNNGIFRGNLVVGSLWTTIDNTQDIQEALDDLNEGGGGTLYLKPGTYTQNTALTGYSSIAIVGTSPSETIIDFNSTSANLSYTGGSVYSTGTITSITSGVNVTGSGTSWLANASAGQHLFLGTRWYQIAAVTGDTTLILAEGYGDNVTMPGAAYRIASVKQNISISNIGFKNSTGTGLVFTDARKITLDNLLLLDNNKGAVFTNVSECNNDRTTSVSNTSNGIELTNVGLSDWESVNSISNGGSNFVLNNVKTMLFWPIAANSATTDGVNVTTGVDIKMLVEASANGGQGVELVSGCDNIEIGGQAVGNTSDGVKLTATSDNCRIISNKITGNGGYGVNIAAATCDTNTIVSNTFASNTSGAVNDIGTGTVIRGNVGVNDNSTSAQVLTDLTETFEAGEDITNGDALYLNIGNINSIDLEASSSQSLSIADGSQTGLDITGNITLEAWINLESNPAGDYAIVAKHNATGDQRGYFFMYSNQGSSNYKLQVLLSNNGINTDTYLCSVNNNFSLSTWYHVAFSWTASTATGKFVVDGVQSGTDRTSTGTSIANNTADFRIGAVAAGSDFFDGLIDDVRVWNTARTVTEINDNKSVELFQVSGLKGSWHLNNVLTDSSGNSNTLTNNNAATFSSSVPFTTTTGVVSRADASASATANSFVGFAAETVLGGADVDVVVAGSKSGLSGLTVGAQYYLSDTTGAISTSAGTVTRKVGIALSTTKLLVTNIW